jgi:hypothetical protein
MSRYPDRAERQPSVLGDHSSRLIVEIDQKSRLSQALAAFCGHEGSASNVAFFPGGSDRQQVRESALYRAGVGRP